MKEGDVLRYGLPYKGSKNAIAEWIVEQLPEGEVLVDLFGGGGAITHAALTLGKYQKVIYNELDMMTVKAFDMAIHGKFKGEQRWISHEDFDSLKSSDPYVALCFSFGNNCREYAYSGEVEYWKKALHYARVFGDLSLFEQFGIKTDGSRSDISRHKDEYKKKYIKWYMKNIMLSDKEYQIEKEQLEKNIKEESEKLRKYLIDARDAAGIKSSDVDKLLGTNGMAGHYFGRSQWEFPTRDNYIKMQTIMPGLSKDFDDVVGLSILWQSLESLERLERLQRLEVFNLDYREVEIPDGAVIYCDIPYAGTDGYRDEFDHAAFYAWAEQQENIFISEYAMPEQFVEVTHEIKSVLLAQNGAGRKAKEKLFTNRRTLDRYGGNCVNKQLTFF